MLMALLSTRYALIHAKTRHRPTCHLITQILHFALVARRHSISQIIMRLNNELHFSISHLLLITLKYAQRALNAWRLIFSDIDR